VASLSLAVQQASLTFHGVDNSTVTGRLNDLQVALKEDRFDWHCEVALTALQGVYQNGTSTVTFAQLDTVPGALRPGLALTLAFQRHLSRASELHLDLQTAPLELRLIASVVANVESSLAPFARLLDADWLPSKPAETAIDRQRWLKSSNPWHLQARVDCGRVAVTVGLGAVATDVAMLTIQRIHTLTPSKLEIQDLRLDVSHSKLRFAAAETDFRQCLVPFSFSVAVVASDQTVLEQTVVYSNVCIESEDEIRLLLDSDLARVLGSAVSFWMSSMQPAPEPSPAPTTAKGKRRHHRTTSSSVIAIGTVIDRLTVQPRLLLDAHWDLPGISVVLLAPDASASLLRPLLHVRLISPKLDILAQDVQVQVDLKAENVVHRFSAENTTLLASEAAVLACGWHGATEHCIFLDDGEPSCACLHVLAGTTGIEVNVKLRPVSLKLDMNVVNSITEHVELDVATLESTSDDNAPRLDDVDESLDFACGMIAAILRRCNGSLHVPSVRLEVVMAVGATPVAQLLHANKLTLAVKEQVLVLESDVIVHRVFSLDAAVFIATIVRPRLRVHLLFGLGFHTLIPSF
jgi:uncharacterized protein YlxP (DUF503 family)